MDDEDMDDDDRYTGLGYPDDLVLPDPDAVSGDHDEYYRLITLNALRDLQQRPDDEPFLNEVIRMVEIWIDYTKETVHTIGFLEGYDHRDKRTGPPSN